MIADLISLKGLWSTLFMTCLMFGFAPGTILRLAVLTFPHGSDRRSELVAELYVVSVWDRPRWVAQQLEVALFEGLAERIEQRKSRRAAKSRSERQELLREQRAFLREHRRMQRRLELQRDALAKKYEKRPPRPERAGAFPCPECERMSTRRAQMVKRGAAVPLLGRRAIGGQTVQSERRGSPGIRVSPRP